jgi:hypothetical protein
MAEFDENEIEFGRAAVAMLADGYEPARCHWLVTCACSHSGKVRPCKLGATPCELSTPCRPATGGRAAAVARLRHRRTWCNHD